MWSLAVRGRPVFTRRALAGAVVSEAPSATADAASDSRSAAVSEAFGEPDAPRAAKRKPAEPAVRDLDGSPDFRDPAVRKEFERTNLHNKMIDVCAKAGHLRGAERLLSRAAKERVHLNRFTYVGVVAACTAVKDATRAEAWLKRMAASGLEPQVEAHSAVVDAFVAAGDTAAAERGLARMREAGVRPNARSYSRLLQAVGRPGGGGAERADRLLAEMRGAGVQPDLVVYTELLGSYAAARDWVRVDATIDEMHLAGSAPSLITYAVLVNACGRTGDVHRAEAFISAAVKDGLELTLALLNAMLNVCARAGKVDLAQTWLNRIGERHGLRPDVISFNTLLGACVRSVDVPAAERALQRMIRMEIAPNTKSYTSMIQVCAKAKKAEQAERWLTRMIDEGLEPDFIAFNVALNACVQAGDLPRLWQVWELMKQHSIVADASTYTTLALPYAKAGDFGRVEALMYESHTMGHAWREREYSALLSAYANAKPKQQRKAERVFRELIAAGVDANEHVQRFLRVAMGAKGATFLLRELEVKELRQNEQRDPPTERRSRPKPE